MANIDNLNIQITATTKSATSSIDNLISKVDSLSKSMNSLNSKGIESFTNSISRLSTGMQGLQGIKKTNYNTIVRGIKAFETIDGNKLTNVATVMTPLSKAIQTLGSTTFDGSGVTAFLNAMTRLSNANTASLNTVNFDQLGDAIARLSNRLASAQEVSSRTVQLVNALARLGATGGVIGNVASALPELSRKLLSFFSTMAQAPSVSGEVITFTSAIAQLASAGAKTLTTAKNLGTLATALKEFFATMAQAPNVSANTIQMTQALADLANAGQRTGTAGRGILGVFNNVSTSSNKTSSVLGILRNGLKSLTSRFGLTQKSGKGLASTIGLLYAKFFMVARAVKALWSSIGSAQDYIEEFNYFNVAMNKVGQDSADQWQENGYNSAEEYADSFKSRFDTLTKQMTGYEVDWDTGDATSTMDHNLGLDLTETMKYNAAITQITNSAGMLGETSITTSKALSMLAADWSSLSNQDLADVQSNLQSGLVGNSRVLYKYGIDITKAGLAQTALAHGLDVNVTSLDQNSKMQLRALTILEQSKVAYGDLGRTINQPANQLRMLTANFKKLALTIGSLFMPVIQKLYPYLNAMVMVLQDFAQWIAKLAGIDLSSVSSSTALADYDYEDEADDIADVADATDDATKSQKKYNDNLQSFDKINKLSDNSDTSTTTTDSGDTGTTSLDLSSDLEDALADYQKIWDDAFNSNENNAVKLAKKIKKALKKGWKQNDFSFLGESLAKKLNKTLRDIPWDKIKKTLKKIAHSVATFLNGFIKKVDWSLVGKTFAEAINTWIATGYEFLTTFDWVEFGTALGDACKGFIDNIDAKGIGKYLGAKLRAIVQTGFGFIKSMSAEDALGQNGFKKLGQKLADLINGFFEDMGNVDEKTGLTGWQELGQTISDGLKGILDSIIVALENINWEGIGTAIGQFLAEIDWEGAFERIKTIFKDLGSGLITALKEAITTNPQGVLNAIKAVAKIWFPVKTFKTLFEQSMNSGISGISTDTVTAGTAGTKLSEIGSALGKVIGVALTAYVTAYLGSAILDKIGEAIENAGLDSGNATLAEFGEDISKTASAINKALTGDTSELTAFVETLSDPNGDNANADFKKTQSTAKAKKSGTTKQASKNSKKTTSEAVKSYTDWYEGALKKGLSDAEAKKFAKNAMQKISGYTKKEAKNASIQYDIKVGAKTISIPTEAKEKLKSDWKSTLKEAYDSGEITKETLEKVTNSKSQDIVDTLKELLDDGKINKKLYKQLIEYYQSDSKSTTASSMAKEAYDSGLITFKQYKKLIKKNYSSLAEFKAELKKTENAQKYLNGDTKAYNKISKKMRDSLKKCGVKTEDLSEVQEELEDAVNDGTISFEDYKKITDKDYDSVSDLYTQIAKIGGNEFAGKVVCNVSGYEDVTDIKKNISELKNKNIHIKTDLTGITTKKQLKEATKELSNAEISAKISPKLRKGWVKDTFDAMKKQWSKTPKNLEVNVEAASSTLKSKSNTESGSGLTNNQATKLAKYYAEAMAYGGLYDNSAGKTMVPTLTALKSKKKGGYGLSKTSKRYKAYKKLIDYANKIGFTQYMEYASGGIPSQGQLFIANEAGAEMVGSMNGKTTVANQDEIATGFATAITQTLAPVMYSAFKQAASETMGQQSGDVYLDGKKVSENVVKNINKISKSTGKNPLWGIN